MGKYSIKKLYVLLIGVLILATGEGCRTRRLPPVANNHIEKDSSNTKITETRRDTSITVPKDSVSVKIALSDLHKDTISGRDSVRTLSEVIMDAVGDGKRASVTITRDGDSLIVTANCDSLQYQLELRDRQIESFRGKISNTEAIKEVKYIPQVYKWLSGIGVLSILIVLIKFLLIIKNPLKF